MTFVALNCQDHSKDYPQDHPQDYPMSDVAKTSKMGAALYRIGDVVKHRIFPFRGIVFDIDPVFNSTEEWMASIPEEMRPRRDQPFYHLLAENAQTEYIAYVSQQNLLPDTSDAPLRHKQVPEMFVKENGQYRPTFIQAH
jgi:heat shock protein HspQ